MYLCYQDISLDCPDTDAANDLGKEGREWERRKHWSWSKQATDEVEFKDKEVEECNIQIEPWDDDSCGKAASIDKNQLGVLSAAMGWWFLNWFMHSYTRSHADDFSSKAVKQRWGGFGSIGLWLLEAEQVFQASLQVVNNECSNMHQCFRICIKNWVWLVMHC